MKIAELPCQEQKPAKKNPKNNRPIELDKFRVVGQIRYIADDKVVMRIECNEQVPNRRANNHPLYLKLTGSIPKGEVGQIWDLEVWRCGTKLTISEAKVYQPSEDDIKLYKLLFEQKMASQTTQDDVPALEPLPRYDKVSPRSAPESSSAGHQNLQQSEKKPNQCQEGDPTNKLTKTPKAQKKSAATITKGDGKDRSKNNSAPLVAGNGEVKQQQSSRFSVQVNGQVFIGQNSITLNRRLLCIDGKPIAQSNLVMVVGQPKTMQADGSVTSSGERSVLISK